MKKLYVPASTQGLNQKFTVQDESGKDVYVVQETGFLPTPKFYDVKDQFGEKIGHITRKRLNFMPRFFIRAKGFGEVTIIKDMVAFKEAYQIKGEGLSIQGDWLTKNFEIHAQGKLVATVKAVADRYEIDLLKTDLEPLVVCFMAGIAFVYDYEKNKIPNNQAAVSQ